ncbi:hypothetical protein PN498_08305 [Oscillatoria sp. CS-180]|uniref:hypothetical protein n=1 Tax=Oscillatoria sp. CS-180 TaxID=3021720 RepID=UPI00232E0EDF|nr:hypothetical protein [Oscillatoria sp. CS-180]MDB9525985.1 hypothetical protein [Oscillatoria sp. CS-180]
MTFLPVLNLSALDGSNGFVLNGIDADDSLGNSVSEAGDVNGDGIDDFIIGAPGADNTAGASYVVFGSNTSFNAQFDLSTLNGSNGFVINGIAAEDFSGVSVSAAGDINGDGVDDLIIGASGRNNQTGESYVVFGTDAGFDAQFNLATLNGSNGFILDGVSVADLSGASVSGAGDVNGDGIDDLIIGAPNTNANGKTYAGESYVVFGSNTGFSDRLNLATLDGNNGFVLEGSGAADFSGGSVSGAGDVNGDGIDDLIVGADRADSNGNRSGESYVVFGTDEGFEARLDLAALNGSNGFAIAGVDRADRSGFSVSGAGDINGDGINDLIIGAPGAGPNNAGESYVVFGTDEGFEARLNLTTLNGSNGFVIDGVSPGGGSGFSVSRAGDINDDGFADLVIGAYRVSPNGNRSAGESYVVFGSEVGFGARLDLATLNGSNGFAITGIDAFDFSGRSVSAAGDINGDGIDDLIIGAPDAESSNDQEAGESYVIFGRRSLESANSFLSFELSRQVIRPLVGDIPYTPVEVGGINLGHFFDEGYYLNQNPDVVVAVDSGLFSSGFDHFVQFGLAEGRNSNPLFSEQGYLAANADVANAVNDGLIDSGLQHFLLAGHLEGRNPGQLFNEAEYLALHPDVDAAVQAGDFGSGFEHYVEAGAPEGRLPEFSLFQEDFYLAQNPDVASAIEAGAFVDGFAHFAQLGAIEGRNPSSLFSNETYLNANPDVAAAVEQGNLPSGFLHYAAFGAAEGRALV